MLNIIASDRVLFMKGDLLPLIYFFSKEIVYQHSIASIYKIPKVVKSFSIITLLRFSFNGSLNFSLEKLL